MVEPYAWALGHANWIRTRFCTKRIRTKVRKGLMRRRLRKGTVTVMNSITTTLNNWKKQEWLFPELHLTENLSSLLNFLLMFIRFLLELSSTPNTNQDL